MMRNGHIEEINLNTSEPYNFVWPGLNWLSVFVTIYEYLYRRLMEKKIDGNGVS